MTRRDDDLGDNVIPLPGFRRDVPTIGRGPRPVGAWLSVLDGSEEHYQPPDTSILAAAAEAVLFTAGDPVPLARLRALLEPQFSKEVQQSVLQPCWQKSWRFKDRTLL